MTLAQVASAAQTLPARGEPIVWGTAVDWAMTLTLVLSALILAGVIISLVVFRGRQTEGRALWIHLLTLGIFPLFLIVIGNFAVVEYAKDVRFCGGCHVPMGPWVDDLHNKKSDSLAAAHYLQRSTPGQYCYLCHADYGVHGTFVAKLSGLKDVYKLVTHTYPTPIKMYAPFSNELCLKCHNGSKAFMSQGIHLDDDGKVSSDLVTQDTDCTQCHGPAHELPKAQRRAEAR